MHLNERKRYASLSLPYPMVVTVHFLLLCIVRRGPGAVAVMACAPSESGNLVVREIAEKPSLDYARANLVVRACRARSHFHATPRIPVVLPLGNHCAIHGTAWEGAVVTVQPLLPHLCAVQQIRDSIGEGLDAFYGAFGLYVLQPVIFNYLESLVASNMRTGGGFPLTPCLERLRYNGRCLRSPCHHAPSPPPHCAFAFVNAEASVCVYLYFPHRTLPHHGLLSTVCTVCGRLACKPRSSKVCGSTSGGTRPHTYTPSRSTCPRRAVPSAWCDLSLNPLRLAPSAAATSTCPCSGFFPAIRSRYGLNSKELATPPSD